MFDDGERGERGGSQTLAPIWSYQGSFISLEETARFDRESDRMPPYSRFSSFHSVGSRVLARPLDQAGRRRAESVCSQKRRYIMEEFVLATMSMTGENKGLSPHQLTACHNARALVVILICPYGLFIPHRFLFLRLRLCWAVSAAGCLFIPAPAPIVPTSP